MANWYLNIQGNWLLGTLLESSSLLGTSTETDVGWNHASLILHKLVSFENLHWSSFLSVYFTTTHGKENYSQIAMYFLKAFLEMTGPIAYPSSNGGSFSECPPTDPHPAHLPANCEPNHATCSSWFLLSHQQDIKAGEEWQFSKPFRVPKRWNVFKECWISLILL